MKLFIAMLGVALLMSAGALAQDKKADKAKETKSAKAAPAATTMQGYVVDAMCAKGMMKNPETTMKKVAAHTKDCALEEECAASGYGLISDGKWYKFDEKGDKEAKAWVENTKLEKGLMVEVSGKMAGDNFVLASIKESSKDEKKSDMKMEKKDGHEGHKH